MKSGEFRECHDVQQWRKIMVEELSNATRFEIHCWNEEQEWIELALQFGNKKEFNWKKGTVIAGDVNPAFVEWILGFEKPMDTRVYDKMTPFFTIALDNGFWSSHYGTELSQE